MGQQITIDQVLAKISAHLHLSKETEYELLAEIRTHLEEAVAQAIHKGEDGEKALLTAAEQFGVDEVGLELQEIHANREALDAILATALPIIFTLILRWLAYAPDGSALSWVQLLMRPGFWGVAIAALVIPLLFFHRSRMALAGWGIFWLLSVIFVIFPSISHW
ncbi:MAG: hypothetical protein HUU37_00370 [Bdellovibrionales bacterium]|jgi:hypothetical protein|nr:hypothetical protein [Bdellovibrionales bacterium]